MAKTRKYPGVREKRGQLFVYYRNPLTGRQVEEGARDCRTRAEAAEYRAQRMAEGEAWRPMAEVEAVREEEYAGAPRFLDLCRVYREQIMPAKKCQNFQRDMLSVVEREFGPVPLAFLTPERAEQWVQRLSDPKRERPLSPSTVRKYARFLGRVYTATRMTAAGRRLLAGIRNPVTGEVMLPAEPAAQKKAYTPEQARAVLAAVRKEGPEYLWRWMQLCLLSGLRVFEALRLRVGDVDLDRGVVRPDGKTSTREVALPAILLEWLPGWIAGASEDAPVIGSSVVVPPYKILRKRFASAGVPWGNGGGLTLRNFRTAFTQAAKDAGVPDPHIADQAGHDPATLRRHYAGSNVEQKRSAAEAAAARFTQQLPSRRPANTPSSDEPAKTLTGLSAEQERMLQIHKEIPEA